MDTLTQSQRKTLELAANGLKTEEIADDLHVCRRTVEAHLSGARNKLGARTTTHAAALAVRSGIIKVLCLVLAVNALSLNYSIDMGRPVRTTVRVVRINRGGRDLEA